MTVEPSPVAAHALTIDDAAAALGVSPATVKRLIASEELASFKARGRRLVRPADIDAYTARQVEAELDRRSAYRQWGEAKLRRLS
jgi:excisionase family DNA binding protein